MILCQILLLFTLLFSAKKVIAINNVFTSTRSAKIAVQTYLVHNFVCSFTCYAALSLCGIMSCANEFNDGFPMSDRYNEKPIILNKVTQSMNVTIIIKSINFLNIVLNCLRMGSNVIIFRIIGSELNFIIIFDVY